MVPSRFHDRQGAEAKILTSTLAGIDNIQRHGMGDTARCNPEVSAEFGSGSLITLAN